ncbi:Hypothetical protein A7982_09671 [Minicystis rosea]|nr:Hypothetical protein A7982_09671 [Minicystis rosea]
MASATPSAIVSSTASASRKEGARGLPGVAVRARVEHGDIVVEDADGRSAVLTSLGADSQAELGPDGQTVVFARRRSVDGGEVHDLFIARVTGGAPELLVAEDPKTEVKGYPLSGLRAPEHSVDGKRVFFLVDNGYHNDALCSVDRATKVVSVITSFWDHRQIHEGPLAGHFLVLKSKDGRLSGESQCFVVHATTGEVIRPESCQETKALVGEDDVFGVRAY